MRKYFLEFRFRGDPECERCMMGVSKDGAEESISICAALGSRPKCTEEGCRKDCPLIEDRT